MAILSYYSLWFRLAAILQPCVFLVGAMLLDKSNGTERKEEAIVSGKIRENQPEFVSRIRPPFLIHSSFLLISYTLLLFNAWMKKFDPIPATAIGSAIIVGINISYFARCAALLKKPADGSTSLSEG